MRGGKRTGAGRKAGAVSKAKRELADMAKDHASAALETLVTVHQDKDQPTSARVAAAVAILDRAYGKPPQAIIGDPDNPLRVQVLSSEPMSADDWERQYGEPAEAGLGAATGTAEIPR